MTPDFKAIGAEIGAKTAEKNRKYGDAAGKTGAMFRVIYPDGIPVSAYEDVLLLVRILDKVVRVATGAPDDEESPYSDISGYGLIGVGKDQREVAIAEPEPDNAASVLFCGCVCRAKDGAYTMTYCDKHFPKGVKPGDLVAASIPYHYSPPEEQQ